GPTVVSNRRSFPPPNVTGKAPLVRFVNELVEGRHDIGEPITAIHRHGGFQNPEDDGYPLDTFCFGESRDYFYPNRADAGLLQNEHSTMWYHDHAIDITAENVYRGLAGFYVSHNVLDTGNETDPPPALGLPSGDFDIGLVIQDRLFDGNGFLVYDNFDHNGFLGDKFLVNGKIQPFLTVQRRKYRFRILNGSSARVYQLFLSNDQPFIAIATDSTLLERPVRVQRKFKFDRSFGAWTINGEFFDENRVDARPRVREPEIWILESAGGWVHPVHIHVADFFILSRDGKTPPPLEQGRKETVLIGGD